MEVPPTKPRLVSTSQKSPKPPWVWFLVGCGGLALIAVVTVGVLAWMWSRTLSSLQGENVPLEMAQAIADANPGTDLGVTEADVSSLPAWIPRLEGVEVQGFTAQGGGLLMGTSTSTVDEVLDFYIAELTSAGFEIPSVAGLVRNPDNGLLHAMSPDGCRSVRIAVGDEAGTTEINYQFHDCAGAPGGEPAGATRWTRPLPDGLPRAEGNVRVALLQTFAEQQEYIGGLAFSPDATMLASASHDGTVRVWDVKTGEELHSLEETGEGSRATALAFHPQGRLLAYGRKGWLHLHDFVDGPAKRSPGADRVAALQFHGDGGVLALATDYPGSVQLLDAADDWRPRWRHKVDGDVEELALSRDGERFAVAVPCGFIELGDAKTGKRIRIIKPLLSWLELCGEYFAAAFSPDLAFAANATDGPEIFRWDLSTGRSLDKLANPRGGGNLEGVTALAFHPEGELLAAGTVDGRVELWDWASESMVGELFDVTGSDVARIVFSADGRRMAVGDWYGVVRVMDMRWEVSDAGS